MINQPASGNAPSYLRPGQAAPEGCDVIPFYRTVEEQRRMLRDIAFDQAKDITPKHDEGMQQ